MYSVILIKNNTFKPLGFVNKQFNEVGWFYCSSGVTTIDRYVVFNYAENSWTIGQLSRSAWMDEGIFDGPLWQRTPRLM